MKEKITSITSDYVTVSGIVTRRGNRAIEVRQSGQSDLVIVPLAYSEIDIAHNGSCSVHMRRDMALEIGFII